MTIITTTIYRDRIYNQRDRHCGSREPFSSRTDTDREKTLTNRENVYVYVWRVYIDYNILLYALRKSIPVNTFI